MEAIGEWGPAWLVQVVEGPLAGTLLALTPSGMATAIEDKLADTLEAGRGRANFKSGEGSFSSYAGVVVHSLDCPGPGFRGDDVDTSAVGKTYLEEIQVPDHLQVHGQVAVELPGLLLRQPSLAK